MISFKWFDKVNEALARLSAKTGNRGPLDRFDFDSLLTKSWTDRFRHWLFFRVLMRPVFAFLRTFFPILRLGRLVVISRYADVVEVLENRLGNFPVVYDPEMTALGGAPGVLGLDGEPHDTLRTSLVSAFTHEDLATIQSWARDNAEALLRAGEGEIDVARDLITRTATEVCCRYFGISAQDPDALAEWAMAVSMQLFGDPLGGEKVFRQSHIGATLLRSLVNDAIKRAKANHARFLRSKGGMPAPDVMDARFAECPIIERLLFKARLDEARICSAVVGMVTGFVPTNTLAAGNMLNELMRRPSLYAEACEAARKLAAAREANDPDEEAAELARLKDALFVAARFNPALSPGIWRHSPNGGEIRIDRGRSPVVIKPGSLILASVYSALRDSGVDGASPEQSAWLIFGAGPHECIGAQIAMTQIAEVFAALLAKPGLRCAAGKWGKMWRAGPFPIRFDMRYDCPAAGRSLLVSVLQVREDVVIGDVRKALELLGNPVRRDIRDGLDASGCIEFASLNVIEQDQGSSRSLLLVEINGDGADASLVQVFADHGQAWLGPILAFCTLDGAAPPTPKAMGQLLLDNVLNLHRKPWGATGLHFDGLPELSVADCIRQDRVARMARELIDRRLGDDRVGDMRAMDMLLFVRRIFKNDFYWKQQAKGAYAQTQSALADTANKDLAYAIVRPSRKRLRLTDWQPPKSLLAPLWPMLKSPDGRPIVLVFAGLWALLGYQIYRWVLSSEHSMAAALWQMIKRLVMKHDLVRPEVAPPLDRFLWALPSGLFGGLIATLLLLGSAIGVIVWRLRVLERRDWNDDRIVPLEDLREIAQKEDYPGYEQNHIIALMPFKPGLLRRLTFAFSMWWIKQAVTFWFRPGFVATMGTIHKARWFRIPGTRQFVFNSNYDGSWESYLEDFVTRVHAGQTSAWSHGIGFPPTRFLVLDGARDGDRFKRWVRRQQRPSLCWYARFPRLTATQIRRNAMIEDGLARAANDTDARRWLANFGSAQREVDELESQEVQAIVFDGLKKHRYSTALMVRLPDEARQREKWLDALLTGGPADSGLARIDFGDLPFSQPTLTLGLSATALRRFGITSGRGFDQLPGAFAMGMAARAKLLGDRDPVALPDNWRWADAPEGSEFDRWIEAVLIVYGSREGESGDTGTAHRRLVDLHVEHLIEAGGSVVHSIPCAPVRDKFGNLLPDREHFGFRDGISQPVIRGSRRESYQPPARDVVAPGEFILGYRNDQGYVSPPIAIGAEHDPRSRLPTIAERAASRFPMFGNQTSNPDLRDFGRNGTFLVLRQLDQDVEGFWAAMEEKSAILNPDETRKGQPRDNDSAAATTSSEGPASGGNSGESAGGAYPKIEQMIGHRASAEWIAAKIIGRWPDGTPLVGNPSRSKDLSEGERPDNDFAFGIDDPRGHACPLGSHIRRTNPRDSLEPGDKEEQRITNRHRILRRGRSYDYVPPGEEVERKGLLFAALCSDLERQFEFVQHTWINASSFHGLGEEADPLLGNPLTDGGGFFPASVDEQEDARLGATGLRGPNTRFTIPTASGPIVIRSLQSYVMLRGGGYFFLPSRSALTFLADGS